VPFALKNTALVPDSVTALPPSAPAIESWLPASSMVTPAVPPNATPPLALVENAKSDGLDPPTMFPVARPPRRSRCLAARRTGRRRRTGNHRRSAAAASVSLRPASVTARPPLPPNTTTSPPSRLKW